VHPCFLATASDRCFLSLRRYSDGTKCTLPWGYHDASVRVGEGDIQRYENGCWGAPEDFKVDHDDPRWPTHCSCGYEFKPGDVWQHHPDRIYEGGGGRWSHRDLPVGAMYVADWEPLDWYWDNQTESSLHVITPGGTWNTTGRASNCTLPKDRLHRCWVVNGVAPNLTINKAGLTCAAGAGSIICGNYHGFLQNGSLT
jgi:hypothetical protein